MTKKGRISVPEVCATLPFVRMTWKIVRGSAVRREFELMMTQITRGITWKTRLSLLNLVICGLAFTILPF